MKVLWKVLQKGWGLLLNRREQLSSCRFLLEKGKKAWAWILGIRYQGGTELLLAPSNAGGLRGDNRLRLKKRSKSLEDYRSILTLQSEVKWKENPVCSTCVYVCVSVRACLCIQMSVCAPIYVRMCMHVHVCMGVHACICPFVCIWLNVCLVCMCVHMHVCVHACTYMYVCVCVCVIFRLYKQANC